jgi:RHS repeat-associated protein
VDTRTGQYGSAVTLATLYPRGPLETQQAVSLTFSMMTQGDGFFGDGWSLNVSGFDLLSNQLMLLNGNIYKVERLPVVGGGFEFKDRKLKDLVVRRTKADTIEAIHKDGKVEVLRRPTQRDNFRITTLRFENGETFTFSYGLAGELQHILDQQQRPLLTLTYAQGRLRQADTLTDGGRVVRTSFSYLGQTLRRITVPYDKEGAVETDKEGAVETAAFEFHYKTFGNGLVAIEKVLSPMGCEDLIDYTEFGHAYANNDYIPRVASWQRLPGAGQPAEVRTYQYSSPQNFTGYPFSAGFLTGEDNLLRLLGEYDYWTEESILGADDAVLSVTRYQHNRFHLLTEESHSREDTQTIRRITYNEVKGESFADQPANLQLPSRISTLYKLDGDAGGREEVILIQTNEMGNELSRTPHSGIRQEYSYYPVSGEGENCPPEPQGFFERYVKQERLVPASGSAASRVTDHVYTRSPTGDGSYFVLLRRTARDTGVITEQAYFDDIDDPVRHGRLKASTFTIDGLSQVCTFTYTVNDERLIETRRLMGREGHCLESSRTLSLVNRRLLEMTRDGGSSLALVYDVSGRLTREIAAPGKKTQAQRCYAYHFATPAKRAHLVTTDALNNRLITYFDGLGRQISSAECLSDTPGDERLVGTWSYDAQGRMVEEVRVDYLPDGARTLKTFYTFNRWGEKNRTVQSDGRVVIDDYDPLLNLRVSGAEGEALFETTLNEHDQPVRLVRVSTRDEQLELETRSYDGWGRCIEVVDARQTRTENSYDGFDRVIRIAQIPADATPARLQELRYVAGTCESLVSEILVDGKSLGTCQYDSLGRLVEQRRGTAPAFTWEYKSNSLHPAVVISPRGVRQTQTYDEELDELIRSETPGHLPFKFEYDPVTSGVLYSEVGDLTHTMRYDANGHPAQEGQSAAGESVTSTYRYSPGGRLLQHTASDGQISEFGYDARGRFCTMRSASMTATQSYDGYGRPLQLVTTYLSSTVTASIVYDTFGREAERSIEEGGVLLQRITSTYHPDGLLASRKLLLGNNQTLIAEHYTYDGYSRLITYLCTGRERPHDQQGFGIVGQQFTLDGLDNVTRVITHFANGGQDTSDRYFTGDDPTRLTRLTHTIPMQDVTLCYDAAGNLLRSHAGITNTYSDFEQLSSVQTDRFTCSYRYDAEGRQVLATRGNEPSMMLVYANNQLETLTQGDKKIKYLSVQGQVLARVGGVDGPQLQITDAAGSVRGLSAPQEPHVRRHYTPYGDTRVPLDGNGRTLADLQLPAFKGERLDASVNLYHLGNGQRAYDPQLMVFLSPDPLSPFGKGGFNSYAYCAGDPVNRSDPSGLFPSWLKWALTGVALALSVVTLGLAALSIATSLTINAGILAGTAAAGAKFTTSIVMASKIALATSAGFGTVSGTLSMAGMTIEAIDKGVGWDRSSSVNGLGWASFAFAVLGLGASFVGAYTSGSIASAAAMGKMAARAKAGRLTFWSRPTPAGWLGAGKRLVGLSYQFSDYRGITVYSQTYAVFRFGLQMTNFYRSLNSRITSLQGSPDEPAPVRQPPEVITNRFVDMYGSSADFYEKFRDEVLRIRQPIMGEWRPV